MSRTFAAEFKFHCLVSIEQDYSLDAQKTIFRTAETNYIDADLPRHFSRRTAQRNNCVRKAGAIKMNRQIVRFGDIRQSTQFIQCVNATIFGDLR